VRFTTNGVCSKTYNRIYVARTNEDLSTYICNVCEFFETNYCMPTRWLTGPLQKSSLPGSNLWLRHWLWGAALFDSPRGGTFLCRVPAGGSQQNGLIWAAILNPAELPNYWRSSNLSWHMRWLTNCKQRCGGVLLAHTLGCHIKKTKWETSDAWKSRLNEASSSGTVLKFGSESQNNVQAFLWFSLNPHELQKGQVTISLTCVHT